MAQRKWSLPSSGGWRKCKPQGLPVKIILRYGLVLVLLTVLVVHLVVWKRSDPDSPEPVRHTLIIDHPIKKLMMEARSRHDDLLERQSFDIQNAAARYREKRGRHPPPGFDKWMRMALKDNAVVVEDFFDRIYKDLTPFWALDHKILTDRANAWWWTVKVREGKAFGVGDTEGRVPWLQHWTALVEEFAHEMPDVDMPVNMMDESRILVPYTKVEQYVKAEGKNRKMTHFERVITENRDLKNIDARKPQPYDPDWTRAAPSFWSLAVKACGPFTPAYGVKPMVLGEWEAAVQLPPLDYNPEYSWRGYVRNWTAAMDPCLQPHLRYMHGTFIEPISISTTEELIPLFGGSKLPMNNDILIPGAMYLTDEDRYSGGSDHGSKWSKKKDGVVWRGYASGGRSQPYNWHHFHRQRLVDMLNSTTVSLFEQTGERPLTFDMPSQELYKSERQKEGTLGPWLAKFANVGFTYFCERNCEFFNNFFKMKDQLSMKSQYKYKFLPDVDGNSFSARFRAFMLSTSLPLKATIYAEWHDDRLLPWVHFMPLDNTFRDLYPLLEYLGDVNGEGDLIAQTIAEAGQKWSEKVLRREDMKLYTYRLLLEWARICDENRDTMGYVADLEPQP